MPSSPSSRQATLPPQVTPPEVVLDPATPYAVAEAEVIALPVLPADPAAGDDAGNDAGPLLGPGADEVDAALSAVLPGGLVGVLEAERATGKVGEVVRLPLPEGLPDHPDLRLVLLVGVGAATRTDLRRAGATLARAVTNRATVATSLALVADDLEPLVVGLVLGSFAFHWRSEPPEHVPARRVVLAGPGGRGAGRAAERDRRADLDRALAVAGAGWRARHLATVPSNLKNPPWLADQARALADEAGLKVRIWDEADLAAEGFGGILGVGQASATPPRLIRLDYAPRRASRRTPTVVLVGKGITFDSGGLSIKPGEAMSTMKRDVTGGAVVMATMAALRAVGCPVRVVGLVPAAENAVGGSSLRPGDVLRHWGGRTSEVTNTDAEGRLVLADAMAYAVAEIGPAAMVDVATLTGAMKVALGQRTGGFFANDEALAAAIEGAGGEAGEPLWRFPLAAVYEPKLSSTVADADNGPGGPGAITAALFLQHFAGGVPWAHLDVASAGDAPGEHFEWTTGPTGFGARALLAWLGSADPLAGVGTVAPARSA